MKPEATRSRSVGSVASAHRTTPLHATATRRGPAARGLGGASALRQRGVSLVELLVSSAIGIFLTGGALLVYIEGRDAAQVSTSVARMLENSRMAFSIIEPDVRAANYWGMHDFPTVIEGRATDTAPLGVAVADDCEGGFSIDVEAPLEGSNGEVPDDWACLDDGQHQPGSDILVVRHANDDRVDAADIQANRIYIRSDEVPRGALFVNAEPGGFSVFAENHALSTTVYYVRPWSYNIGDGIPALRRKILGVGPVLRDEEVIAGVEDLQFQLGLDLDQDDAADLFVDADNPVLNAAGASVVAVRVWLLMRAESPELGLDDDRAFVYADVQRTAGTAQFPGDIRRVLLSRTISVRNL